MNWTEVFDDIMPLSRDMQCPFNVRDCYESYLKSKGFRYVDISNKKGSVRPTVQSFAESHKKGTYYLNVTNHCVTVVDGSYYGTWDSGSKSLYGYYEKTLDNHK